jgi:hexosaminidase
VSRNLSEVAELGLRALENLKEHRPVSADERQRNIDFLKNSAKPQAVLLLMVAPSVERLVEATRIQ